MEPRIWDEWIGLFQSPFWLNEDKTVAEVPIKGTNQIGVIPGHHFYYYSIGVKAMFLCQPFGVTHENKGVSFRTRKVDFDFFLWACMGFDNHGNWF